MYYIIRMVEKRKYFRPKYSKRFKRFLQDNTEVISKIFSIVKTFKPNIFNTYRYSSVNPPLNPLYKYTEKLYIGCIIYVMKYSSTWESFIGPIGGKQVHKRHMEYLNNNVYKIFFDESLNEYLKTCTIKHKNTTKNFQIDATIGNNKLCEDAIKNNPYNKNRKGIKTSLVTDSLGAIFDVLGADSAVHDSKLAKKNIKNITNNKIIMRSFRRHNNKAIFLADSAYDTKAIKKMINDLGLRSIIKQNKRNTKDPAKIQKLTKHEKKVYNRRIKAEHTFGILKKAPKVNCVYEKTIESYLGIILLTSAIMNINKTNRLINKR